MPRSLEEPRDQDDREVSAATSDSAFDSFQYLRAALESAGNNTGPTKKEAANEHACVSARAHTLGLVRVTSAGKATATEEVCSRGTRHPSSRKPPLGPGLGTGVACP